MIRYVKGRKRYEIYTILIIIQYKNEQKIKIKTDKYCNYGNLLKLGNSERT